MNQKYLTLIFLVISLALMSCGGSAANVGTSTEDSKPVEKELDNSSSLDNNFVEIIEQLHSEINQLKSDIEFQNDITERLKNEEAMKNPFGIYNKEIVLENGSSVLGKIIYQDTDVMKVETLIGKLIIDRNTIVRVVNWDGLGRNTNSNSNSEQASYNQDNSGQYLIQQRIESQSAKLILLGDIIEEKNQSGNTILKGQIKNIGAKRADFAKVIFTFRINWQGDTESRTTFVKGSTYTFDDTDISSDNSLSPSSVGDFELVIPKDLEFIGYSYEINFTEY